MYIESLKYPFNLNVIQTRKRSIKKELFQGGGLVEKKIATMGGILMTQTYSKYQTSEPVFQIGIQVVFQGSLLCK